MTFTMNTRCGVSHIYHALEAKGHELIQQLLHCSTKGMILSASSPGSPIFSFNVEKIWDPGDKARILFFLFIVHS